MHMKIERRVKHKDMEIFIADGYCSKSADDPQPHFRTMYAIAHDAECLTVGEFFTTPVIFPIQRKCDRLDEAEIRGKEFLDNMRAECPA